MERVKHGQRSFLLWNLDILVDVSLTNSRANVEKQSQQNYFIYENKLKYKTDKRSLDKISILS